MNEEKINNFPKKLRILVAPLDWGLGHATRCIPIIHSLLKHNTEVVLAARGAVKTLLEKAFPELEILPLDGYQISYSRHKKLFLLNLITQLPKVFLAIRNEEKWLQRIVEEQKIDGIISDNRPGLHHASIPCVYITHQLQIQTGSKITDTYMRNMHYRFINKFRQCWIPDNASEGILGGALSHPVSFPNADCKYIGILSRFEKKPAQKKYDYVLLISGPEPQRSILESKLLQAFDQGLHSFALVRGLPGEKATLTLHNNKAVVFNHLDSDALSELISQADIVVARSGYSTVMDLCRLQKKAVLIPTPGQTEQEYLATYLDHKKLFTTIDQEDMSLENIQSAAKKNTHPLPDRYTVMHENVVSDWLSSIRQPAPAI